jgi:rubrerythrin
MDEDEIARLREEIDRYESHYRSIADAEVRKTLSALIAEKRKRLNELEGKPPAT